MISDDIKQRLKAYRSSGNFDQLWPEISVASREAAHREIFAVTQALLNDSTAHTQLSADDDRHVRVLGITAFVSRMGALLGYWIERDLISADPPVARVFAEHLSHGRQRARVLGEQLASVLKALGEQHVRAIVLKGAHTSRAFFPEPGIRPMADLDLLVHPTADSGPGGPQFARPERGEVRFTWVVHLGPSRRPTHRPLARAGPRPKPVGG